MRGIGSFFTLLLLFIAAAGFLLAQNIYLRQERDQSAQAQIAAETQAVALSGQVSALRGEINRLQTELAAVLGQRDGLAARVAQLEGQVSALQAELQRARDELARAAPPAAASPVSPADAEPPAAIDLALAVMAAGALALTLTLVGLVFSLPAGKSNGRGRRNGH